ncbi:class II aldolase/adducin N-terminal [Peziza echinospora]|nr:class II aldolase/adducin N-terminal [Peziza echinospora]
MTPLPLAPVPLSTLSTQFQNMASKAGLSRPENANSTTTTSPPPDPSPKTVQPGAKKMNMLQPPTFTSKLKERHHIKRTLACAFRIFARYGFDEGVAGHITVRDPILTTHFWVNPFGMHFSLIKSSDLILVDGSTGEIHKELGKQGRILNTAAFMIHGAIHAARTDVHCAAHAHTLYGRTWCAMGRELDMLTQDSCAFFEDQAVFGRFGGLVLAEDEGRAIAEALGGKKVALLQNHGLLATGSTIEETVFWFLSLEKCCQTQLLADAAAAGRGYQTIKIGNDEAAFTYKVVGTKKAGWFSGKALFDKVFKEEGADFDDEEEPAEEAA